MVSPGPGGVYDFASKLAGPIGAPVVELARTTDTSAWSGDLLLLHFSGYGFHNRGVPVWLNEEMRSLKKRFRVFGVVFHELFAFGPPWRSAFWLSGKQRKIASELASQADFWLTNRDTAAEWLMKHAPSVPHATMPVFSNVGEPASIDADGRNPDREHTMVVFGSNTMRMLVYAWNDGEIFKVARQQGLRIHDIGPTIQDAAIARRMAREGVIVQGRLSAEQVSAAMLRAEYGVLAYSPAYAAKSGIFAAYAAHGVCPVMLCKGGALRDGFQPGVNYFDGFDALGRGKSQFDARSVGRAARQWYEPHSIDAQIATLMKLSTEARS
ncbi:MAG: hypothetical protein ACRYGA_10250 [Janthinobacterium lividum]